MTQYLPNLNSLSALNTVAIVYLCATAVLGMVVATLLGKWRCELYIASAPVVSLALLIVTAFLHASTIWVLLVDPRRVTGTIPLPAVAKQTVLLMAGGLMLPGYFLQGLVIPYVRRAWKARQILSVAITIIAVTYSEVCVPWFAERLFD
jgi:hypothetical protein